MSPTFLLDANALIALTLADHEHHQRAAVWAAGIERIALCPIVEGALVRFLIRLGESHATARALLTELHAMPARAASSGPTRSPTVMPTPAVWAATGK